jgi:hypothetical protein
LSRSFAGNGFTSISALEVTAAQAAFDEDPVDYNIEEESRT